MNMADLILEMSAALNSGYMKPLEERTTQNTTSTSCESFVTEEFCSSLSGQVDHSISRYSAKCRGFEDPTPVGRMLINQASAECARPVIAG